MKQRWLWRGLACAAALGTLALPGTALARGELRWTQQVAGTGQVLKGVNFVDSCRGWAVGEPVRNGTNPESPPILMTRNGGQTWATQQSGLVNTTLNSVQFVDRRTGWIIGEPTEHSQNGVTSFSGPGVILATTDGGDDWTKQTGNVPSLTDTAAEEDFEGLSFTSRKEGWIAVSIFSPTPNSISGRILHTSNGGKSYQDQIIPDPADGVADVYFTDARNGWAVTDGGNVLHTTNGGKTGSGGWTLQQHLATTGLERVRFFDTRHGAVVGDGGFFAWTQDGGATWHQTTTNFNNTLKDLSFVDATHLWVVGELPPTAFEGEGISPEILSSSDGGKTLTSETAPVSQNLNSVSFVRGTTNGWAVGVSGTVITTDAGQRC